MKIRLPELGEKIEGGTVTEVLVKSGDDVRKEQALIELETDKAVIEVPSPQAGRITSVKAKAGEDLSVGDVIVEIEESADTDASSTPDKETSEEASSEDEKEETEKKERKEAPPQEKLKDKDESPKAKADKESPSKTQAKSDEKKPSASSKSKPAANTEPSKKAASDFAAAPSVRRRARELGVNLADVIPSGPDGRILLDDVEAAASKTPAREDSSEEQPAADTAPPSESIVERETLNQVRQATAERMASSWATIPHVTHFDEADITDLEKARKAFSGEETHITVTAVTLRLLGEVLKQFPRFNATLDDSANELVHQVEFNINLAVDTPHGLMAPVIEAVNTKSIAQLAEETANIARRARERKLSPDELRQGTFTLTNLGGIGGIGFTPIVNKPQVAILGLARAQVKPVWVNGAFVPRTMLPLSFSYDHRVNDGADAARFVRALVELLEQPWRALFEQ